MNNETKRLCEKRDEAEHAELLPKWSPLLLIQVTDVAPFNEHVRALDCEPVFVPALP